MRKYNILLIAFGLIFLTLPWAGKALFYLAGMPLYAPEMVILLTIPIFFWVFHPRTWRRVPREYWIGIALLLGGLGLSALTAASTWGWQHSLGIIKAWFLFPLILAFILFQTLREEKTIRLLLWAWYGVVVAVAGVALGYVAAGILTYDGRLQAFYTSPNYLAMFLFPGVFLGWHFIREQFVLLSKKISPLFFFFLIIVTWGIILLALYYTLSYGVWFSILAGFAIIFFSTASLSVRHKLAQGGILFLIVVTLIMLQWHQAKFQDFIHVTERSSVTSRMMIWQSAARMIGDHPLVGIGPGNFQAAYLAYQKYFPPYLEWAVPEPHNLYLAFWLQTGLPGLIGFLLFVWNWLRNTWRLLKNTPLALPLFGIMIALLTHGFLDTPYWKNDLAFVFWILFALGSALQQNKNSS